GGDAAGAAASGPDTSRTAEDSTSATRPAFPAGGGRRDIHSRARPDEVRVAHMDLDWKFDFDRRVLDGSVTLTVERAATAPAAPRLSDAGGPAIRAAGTPGARAAAASWPQSAPAAWRWGVKDPLLGDEMIVDLPEGADLVRIDYRPRPEATGLQWLSPEQTA